MTLNKRFLGGNPGCFVFFSVMLFCSCRGFRFVSVDAVFILIVVSHGMFDSFSMFMILSIISSVSINSHEEGKALPWNF